MPPTDRMANYCLRIDAIHFELLSAYTSALVVLVAGLQATLAILLGTSNHIQHIYLCSLLLTPIVCYVAWQKIWVERGYQY
jgi:hypothetical protein